MFDGAEMIQLSERLLMAPLDARAKALTAAAAAKGNSDFAVQWAGQGAPLAREMPAAELLATLMAEFRTGTNL